LTSPEEAELKASKIEDRDKLKAAMEEKAAAD